MDKGRIKEDYRQHTILAAWHDGKFRGKVWREKVIVHEMEGPDISSTVVRLKQFIDKQIDAACLEAGHTPDESRVLEGLRCIIDKLHDGQRAMLKAHYHAKNQTLTAGELAEAAGYVSHSPVNIHYGNVGKALYELAPIVLPKRKDGTPIYTCYLAEASKDNEDEEYWHWTLRPEVSKAIVALGLDA